MNKYKVAIIGCGSIGALKPDKYDSPSTPNILTHAHAVYNHKQTDLVAVLDQDHEKIERAAAKWKKDKIIRAYRGDHIHCLDLLRIDKPDILILATPTDTHYSILKNIIEFHYHKPRLIIAEKPFCENLEQAKEIAYLYQEFNIPILVNYTRRFETAHRTVKLWIDSGYLGQIRHCRIIYTRGLKREASHAIDLCNWWFGNCLLGYIMEYQEGFYPHDSILCDYSKDDPSYTVYLRYKDGPKIYLSPMDGRDYSIFEIDILGTEGRVRIVNHGLQIQKYSVIPEPVYGDYNTLNYTNDSYIESCMTTALIDVLNNTISYLEDSGHLYCTAQDAVAVHRIYDMLRIKAIE